MGSVVKLALMPEIPLEVSPSDVKARIDAGEAVRLIDVREVQEHQLTRIEGAELIPMNSIPQNLQDLDDDGPALIVFCHHGVRSLSVVDWLRRQGIENCQSMAGGIDLWSLTVDAAVPRY
jgi:rhodanese-related sulfurtransferase